MDGGHLALDFDVARLGNLRVWAERGLVHIEDAATAKYVTISVRDALERASSLSDMIQNRRESQTEDRFDQAKRLEILRFLEQLEPVVRKAKEQGMPTDDAASRDLVRRRAKVFQSNMSW